MSIELKDVVFAYDEASPVLSGLNMSIAPGERVAIVGQNGAGKTTTVKLMNGLLKPTSGSVLVNGTDTSKMTNAKMAQTVAYVFQNPDDQLFQSDVYSELAYIPKYLKWGKQDTEQRLERAISMTGIRPFVDDNPADLPFAIKKFVAIAAVLVPRVDFVILDEPTAGLDGRGLEILQLMLDRLHEDGIGVITITHDMRFVADSFDRVIAMAHGKIQADGTPGEVFARDDVLAECRLQRPTAARIARELGLGNHLGIEEIAAAMIAKK